MADTSKGSNIRETAHDAKHKLQEGSSAVASKTQEAAGSAMSKAQDVASNVASRAQGVASSAADRAEGAISSVGQSMSSLAGTIREKAPHEGMVGSAAGAVADTLQSSGRYLQESNLSDISDDVGSLIRSYPIASLCVAFSIGWLLGMASRR